MLNLLVLTDFSKASVHAAKYACQLSHSLSVRRIILFHAYQSVSPVSVTPMAVISKEELHREYTDQLLVLADQLEPLVEPATVIDLLAEDVLLEDVMKELCKRENIDLVVMGIARQTQVEHAESNAVNVPEKIACPVLVVPENAAMYEISRVVLATDLRELREPAYLQLIRWLDLFHAQLDIVNIDKEEKEFGPESFTEIKELHNWLDRYKPHFHYGNNDQEGKGIVAFAQRHHASLIISFPRHRTFFNNLFHSSITEELAYESGIPLFFVHES